MKVISLRNEKEMSQKAAELVIETVRQNPSATLGLATGSTPLGTYGEMIRDHQKNGTSYRKVTTVNLDEYVGLGADDPNSFRYFMDTHLFEALDMPSGRVHLPDGTAENLDEECKRYDILIEQTGGVDLQLLGIGENGHIGFNEPGTPFASRTHIVELTESTRTANARFFESPEDVPKQAITMGIDSILQSRKILLLAFGSTKAKAIQRLLQGNVSEDFPASVLKLHHDVTLIADQEALRLVEQQKVKGEVHG